VLVAPWTGRGLHAQTARTEQGYVVLVEAQSPPLLRTVAYILAGSLPQRTGSSTSTKLSLARAGSAQAPWRVSGSASSTLARNSSRSSGHTAHPTV
jgi:hypothetical protein